MESIPKIVTLAAEEEIFTGTIANTEAEQIAASIRTTGNNPEGGKSRIYYPASGDTYADFVEEMKGYSLMPDLKDQFFYGYAGTGLVKAYNGEVEVLKIIKSH